MITQVDRKKCCGCKQCADVCPKHAISFETDKYGFWYPVVDDNLCVNCGLCLKKCPVNNDEIALSDKFATPYAFSLWTKDDAIRLDSTSGGVFWEFGKHIIEQGGYVIGSAYSDDWKSAYHFVGENMDDLFRIKGSKYFQSDTEGIWKKTRDCVSTGKKVLFVGSPCQCAALKAFLGKEYKNLYIMDFICRGINSPLPFKRFIEGLEEKFKSKTVYVQLKNKKTGWQSLATYVRMENGKEYHEDKWHNDIWVRGFLSENLYMRDSCHACRYRNIPHGSDFTIADFWGIKNKSPEDMFKGISAMMVNTQKGRDLFVEIKDKFVYSAATMAELLPGNPALVNDPPSATFAVKNKFFSDMESRGFEYAIEHIKEKKHYIRKCLSRIKHIIKKVLKIGLKFIRFVRKYRVIKFIKLNFLSKNIIRDKHCYIYPFKNSIIDISRKAKIVIRNGNIKLGLNKPKGSKAETILKMDRGAVWNCNGKVDIFYHVNLELKENACLTNHFFGVNSGSSIVIEKELEIGDDVMMGRNIIIYDSDFHRMIDTDGFISNYPRKVKICDHVWLTNNIVVLKGVTIGEGSIVSGFVIVKKDIPPHSVVSNGTKNSVHDFRGGWDRKSL